MFAPNFITRVATTIATVPFAISVGLIGGEAKAQNYHVYGSGYSHSQIGNTGFGYTDNGGSYTTQSIGGTTFYNGHDGSGNSFYGSCTTIGNSTFCN